MSFNVDLEEGESLIYQDGLRKSRRAMSLALTDRAAFIARELWLRVDTHYMHRIPFEELDEVQLTRDRGRAARVSAWFFVVLGSILTIFAIIGNALAPPGARNGSMGLAGAGVILAAGIVMLVGKRRVMVIQTKDRRLKYKWKPHVFDNDPEVKALQETFLSACRYMGIRTRRLDLVNQREIRRFWKWFAVRARIGIVREKALKERLKRLCDDVDFDLSRRPNGEGDLRFTANAIRDVVPIVEEIMAAAPPLKGWTFSAFRERIPISELSYGTSFKLHEIYFVPYTDGFSMQVIIYSDWNEAGFRDEVTFDSAAFNRLLVGLVGEYDFAMNLQGYSLEHLSNLDDRSYLRPLGELPSLIDEFHILR